MWTTFIKRENNVYGAYSVLTGFWGKNIIYGGDLTLVYIGCINQFLGWIIILHGLHRWMGPKISVVALDHHQGHCHQGCCRVPRKPDKPSPFDLEINNEWNVTFAIAARHSDVPFFQGIVQVTSSFVKIQEQLLF